MRIARFVADGDVGYGIVEPVETVEPVEPSEGTGGAAEAGSLQIDVIKGHPFGEVERTGITLPLASVRLLAPVLPSKVIAFARTYAAHAQELGNEVATEPLMFLKPSTSVIGPGDVIRMPAISEDVQQEAELAVVIGSLCRDVPAERAHEVVLGYTCANDVTARDLQRRDGQWSRAKGFDTFCPIGPWIETEVDPADLHLSCLIGTETVQDARTSEMVFTVAQLVAYASQAMTLLPGDVILTGTPAGVTTLKPGDFVEVRIERIGSLINPVATENR